MKKNGIDLVNVAFGCCLEVGDNFAINVEEDDEEAMQ